MLLFCSALVSVSTSSYLTRKSSTGFYLVIVCNDAYTKCSLLSSGNPRIWKVGRLIGGRPRLLMFSRSQIITAPYTFSHILIPHRHFPLLRIYLSPQLSRRAYQWEWWSVSVKPGKPVWCVAIMALNVQFGMCDWAAGSNVRFDISWGTLRDRVWYDHSPFPKATIHIYIHIFRLNIYLFFLHTSLPPRLQISHHNGSHGKRFQLVQHRCWWVSLLHSRASTPIGSSEIL